MSTRAQITTPYCGSCGWDVRNAGFATDDLKKNAVCDSCGANMTIHGFGSGTATAGSPGSVSGEVPYDLAGCVTLTPSPATAWTTGQSITLGDTSSAYWDGTAWVTGTAP